MQRSRINAILRAAEAFFDAHGVALPPFAHLDPAAFRAALPLPGVVAPRLGWDVTDFGGGDFDASGLTLVTLRNGTIPATPGLPPKAFAEKVLLVRDGQVTPMHTHHRKTEDIIHRGGAGRLVLELGRAPDADVDPGAPITVWTDGRPRTVRPSEPLSLERGESITLVPGVVHAFWAEGGDVLAGEVSSTNDDATDNHFLGGGDRFTTIEEDAPPYRLLVSDYPALEGADAAGQERSA